MRELPNVGLSGAFAEDSSGWGDDMNLNLLMLSVLVQGTVLDKVAVEPSSPDLGAVYLLDETNSENPNAVAVYDGDEEEADWVYIEPREGWLLYNQDAGYYEKFDGTAWAELETGGGGGSSAYRVGFFFISKPEENEVLAMHVFTDPVTFADDFAGAVGTVGVNPAASFVLTVLKNGASVGTITISTSGVITFVTTGTTVSFAAGDVLSVRGPAVADTTVARCAFTFKGEM